MRRLICPKTYYALAVANFLLCSASYGSEFIYGTSVGDLKHHIRILKAEIDQLRKAEVQLVLMIENGRQAVEESGVKLPPRMENKDIFLYVVRELKKRKCN